MATLHRTTKNGRQSTENLSLTGIGSNLKNTSQKTTNKLRVEFKRKNGTVLCFTLYKTELSFLKKVIKEKQQP